MSDAEIEAEQDYIRRRGMSEGIVEERQRIIGLIECGLSSERLLEAVKRGETAGEFPDPPASEAGRARDETPAAWRPIETAPKDGSSFWGWHSSWFEPEISRWYGASFMPRSVIERLRRTGDSGTYYSPNLWRPRTDVPSPPPAENAQSSTERGEARHPPASRDEDRE